MKVLTSHKHVIVLDDDREFELPISDPYDNSVIEDTMIVTERDKDRGTTLSYLVTDEIGRDWRDLGDDVFMGWEFMVLDSQRDADELSAKLNDCAYCSWDPIDHEAGDGRTEKEALDWIGCTGYEAPPWRLKLDEKRAFLFEKYEHGLVRYALRGESSMVDRQWDVTPIAGILVADDDWGEKVDLEEAARSTLNTFTDWCNGSIYGVVHAYYDAEGELIDDESCWGYIGHEHALECLKEES